MEPRGRNQVAAGGKSNDPEIRSNKPIRYRWQPTATVSQRMVRRGRRFECVRGLHRKSSKWLCCCLDRHTGVRERVPNNPDRGAA
jgi:hypothetical protein